MAAAVADVETRHGNEPLNARGLHAVDENTRGSGEEFRPFENGSKGDVDSERLDNRINAFE
jgi:hypothetical protein